ncbi:GtrA family protein [Aquisphaera insulae]|uniref:GtrA family protein n=1 Tax=Aquisphaera insulae TaxID=2712864 RepID=UPI0013EB47A3|nr:GtrA family protein [Aquisphaera insulae]
MSSFSLIILVSSGDQQVKDVVAAYEEELEARFGAGCVELIHAGRVDPRSSAEQGSAGVTVEASGGEVEAMRAAIRVATGDVIIVLDPRRSYSPRAIVDLVDALKASDSVLAIGVPRRAPSMTMSRSVSHRLWTLGGQAALGTSDAFSGLMAVRRDHIEATPRAPHPARGSRAALDLITWPCPDHVDVPIETLAGDRPEFRTAGLNDLRQLKRVVDQRFGTFSRLVQFCMVGASGMVVDLTLYALFQAGFRRSGASLDSAGFSWALATARTLAILVAMVWNFTLNRRLTFNDSREGSIARQFLTYAMGNALAMLVSLTLSLVLPAYIPFFDDHKLAAAVVGIVLATGISFSMSRWVVFNRRPEDSAPEAGGPVTAPRERAPIEPAGVS